MVSGSTTATKEYFDKYYKEKMDEYIEKKCRFMVGGAKGIDTLTQQYLIKKLYNPTMVTIVDKGTQDNRVSKEFNHKNGFSSYPERDAWMTQNSDIDLAVVNQYGGGGSGTFANIVRRELGNDVAKQVTKLFRNNATPYSSEDVLKLS